jgi:hypothetical protein
MSRSCVHLSLLVSGDSIGTALTTLVQRALTATF